MGAPVSDTAQMIRQMAPRLAPGAFAFRTESDPAQADAQRPLATFREAEGLSMIVETDPGAADAMRQITLTVHSALDGVGLTAAVSSALARADIPANVVAAFHHDHVFVPAQQAERALDVLTALSRHGIQE